DSFADLVFDGKVEKNWTAGWNAAYESLFGPAMDEARKVFATKPDPATPALPVKAYVGSYANDYIGTAMVATDGAGLTLVVGPGGKKTYPMTHFDRDIFLIYPDPEMADVPSPVTFSIGPDGSASSITIDNLNANGLGVLTRQGG
ncbi:MAG: DUF3471 domain-containing protein, partial [Rhizobiaceae bacterium]|nr:DUF3471 domain-containing protein [Rhizobiaceae bacterium]